MLQRAPRIELQPYIQSIWVSEREPSACGGQEITLPNKDVCIVIRFDGTAVELIDADGTANTVGPGVIEGIQTRPIIKERNCTRAVGAVLVPGALPALTHYNASNFTSAVTPLDAVISAPKTGSLIDQLSEAPGLETRLCLFEDFLLNLVTSSVHPIVSNALGHLNLETKVSDLVKASGISHRHFNHLFTLGVGVSPKYYQRLLRMQSGLAKLHHRQGISLSDVALSSGYADQPHFNREFKALTGVTPSVYAGSARRAPLHILR
ncbi:MAG: helix-turn-helix domain-containing protein [Pseudomonadota bacterium]